MANLYNGASYGTYNGINPIVLNLHHRFCNINTCIALNETKGWKMSAGMKRYIEQLTEDLSFSKANASNKLALLYDNAYSPEYVPLIDEEDEGVTVSELIGLESFFFPRTDFLNNVEVSELTNELLAVYHAHGLNPIFASCVSNLIKYGHLRSYLNHKVYPEKGMMVDIEMCDYLPSDCPFALICPSVKNGSKCCEEHKRRA